MLILVDIGSTRRRCQSSRQRLKTLALVVVVVVDVVVSQGIAVFTAGMVVGNVPIPNSLLSPPLSTVHSQAH